MKKYIIIGISIFSLVLAGCSKPCDKQYRFVEDQFGNYEIQKRSLTGAWQQDEQIPKGRHREWGWGFERLKRKIANCEGDRNPIKHKWRVVK